MAPRKAPNNVAVEPISDDEDDMSLSAAPPLRARNKENRAPSASSAAGSKKSSKSSVEAASVDDEEEAETEASSIKAAPKRKPVAASKGVRSANNTNKKGGRAAASEDPDEEVIAETQEAADDDDGEEDDMAIEAPVPVVNAAVKRKGRVASKAAGSRQAEEPLSSREKRLEAKLDLTTETLEQVQAAFAQLRDLRETRAEESEKTLTAISAERQSAALITVQNYKAENDALKAELEKAKQGLGYSPAEREKMLEAEREREREKRDQEERERVVARDAKWERELAKTVKAEREKVEKEAAQLKADLLMVRKELEAEVEHSKSLQAKLKSLPASSVVPDLLPNTSVSAAATSSATAHAHQKLQEEFADLKSRLMLNEDLTGFTVVSVRMEESPTYNCILNDCLDKAGSLNFKLSFLPDGTATYHPDVDVERDAVMYNLLPTKFRSYMRFEAENSGKFFRTLFKSVNQLD